MTVRNLLIYNKKYREVTSNARQFLVEFIHNRLKSWTRAPEVDYIYPCSNTLTPLKGTDEVMSRKTIQHHQDRLKNISARLKLRVSKRARRMTLRLDPETRAMHLIVPPRMDLGDAVDFAGQHRAWIREKLSSLPKAVPFIDGAIMPVAGRDHYLEIIQDDERRNTKITVKNRIMCVETPLDDPSLRIERYLRDWIQTEIDELAREKAAQIRRRIGDVRVRDTKSRWGSCAEDGNLSFCWRLVFAPREVIDYVVAHEVAHLVHFDHSPAFWRLCDRLSVDMAYGRDWLKEYGQTLMSYGSDN